MATTTPQKERIPLAEEVQATIKRLEAKDPGLRQLLKKSHAYAIFPAVGKAGLVIGGSYGRGAVYEKGKLVGYATIGQTTIGVQVGGITFTEVLAFENRQAFERFKQGGLKFAAGAAAVLVKAGAAGQADYEKGVIALAYSKGGMLLEAAIGGQKFNFKPKDGDEGANGGGAEGKTPKSKGRGAKSEGDDSETGDGDEETDGATGLAGRTLGSVRDAASGAIGGVRGAASGVSDLVKRHPWASAAVGTAAVTGVAVLVVRAMRQQAGSDTSEDEDEESDEDSDRAEDQADDEDDQDADEADEGEYDDSDESTDEDADASPRRSRSGGRARSH